MQMKGLGSLFISLDFVREMKISASIDKKYST